MVKTFVPLRVLIQSSAETGFIQTVTVPLTTVHLHHGKQKKKTPEDEKEKRQSGNEEKHSQAQQVTCKSKLQADVEPRSRLAWTLERNNSSGLPRLLRQPGMERALEHRRRLNTF